MLIWIKINHTNNYEKNTLLRISCGALQAPPPTTSTTTELPREGRRQNKDHGERDADCCKDASYR